MILIFLALILTITNIDALNNNKSNKNCFIHSEEHPFEYLYSTIDNPNEETDKNVYIYYIPEVNDYKKISWRFDFASKENKTSYFYIVSNKYNEYLCASESASSNSRKIVRLSSIDDIKSINSLDTCKWRLEKIKSKSLSKEKSRYIIWNKYFDEPLYPSSPLLKTGHYKKNIYLWTWNVSNSNKFKWFINCVGLGNKYY
jgi:hypothetical protein